MWYSKRGHSIPLGVMVLGRIFLETMQYSDESIFYTQSSQRQTPFLNSSPSLLRDIQRDAECKMLLRKKNVIHQFQMPRDGSFPWVLYFILWLVLKKWRIGNDSQGVLLLHCFIVCSKKIQANMTEWRFFFHAILSGFLAFVIVKYFIKDGES